MDYTFLKVTEYVVYGLILFGGYNLYLFLISVHWPFEKIVSEQECDHLTTMSVKLDNGNYRDTCKTCKKSWEHKPIHLHRKFYN